MEALKRRPNISANIDIEIRQDPDLRAAFDFWVRNVYLDRPSKPQVTSCESLSGDDSPVPANTNR
jgi:hypothetical protein